MNRVEINPNLIRWAYERAGYVVTDLERKFPKLLAWGRGETYPTLKQIESFAKATHTPVGYFFLQEPPVEKIPIPDFRTIEKKGFSHPSPDLLDTIYICQQRQEWYRDYARFAGEKPLSLVGSIRLDDNIILTATKIRNILNFDVEERHQMLTWTDALRHFIEQANNVGILVMCNSVVNNNNHRHLDPEEFHGFAIADNLAPLIFINGGDTKSAQMFTLAHELAHIWLGQSAVSNAQLDIVPNQHTERWCNQVAAELLVPLDLMKQEYKKTADLQNEVNRLAKYFKVSTLVILRRIYDAGKLTDEKFQDAYQREIKRLVTIPRGTGGDFYLTLGTRMSKRFTKALISSTLEGRTSFTESFRLLGVKKMETFNHLSQDLGVHK
ncbi:MAG: ImmA/IrrE family metallo-endopeptidase [Candidatus Omnitrophica bacterium]|nr:ImmA/IrrE family metallo-endopeptidase [Candidatus Omnitrophota bacterium]